VRPQELRAQLAKLAISVLRWPPDVELRLQRFGVRTLGDVLRLPRAGLARRIGADRLAELDRAFGRQPFIRTPFRAPERYAERLRLDFEIETTPLLERVLMQSLERLGRFLRERNLAIHALTVQLHHRRVPATQLSIGLARATSEMQHVGRLMHEQLSRLTLPAPVRDIEILADRPVRIPAATRDLFRVSEGDAFSMPERLARLLDQLTTRLGTRAVSVLQARADFRPECAQCRRPIDVQHQVPQARPPDALPSRPLWMLREPRLIRRDSRDTQPFKLIRGPEALELGWWDQASIDREYYIAHSRQGSLWWVYHERSQPAHWYVHGVFG
jgi:protein ImuB